MNGRGRRDKGAKGEKEVIDLAKAHGFTSVRTRSGGGQALSDVVGIPGFAVEVKRQETEKPRAWFEQAAENCGSDTPVAIFRRNNKPWLAVIEADELFALIKAAQS